VTTIAAPPLTIQELAEEPDHYLNNIPPPSRRLCASRFTLLFSPSPTHSATTRIRTTAEELDDTIAEVRRALRDASFVRNTWHIGPSCRPEGLVERLLERGFVPATSPPYEASSTVMILARPPAHATTTTGIEVRKVSSEDEYRQAISIAMEAFNESPEDAKGWYEAVPSLWKAQADGVNQYTHIAFLDGRPVGFGFANVTRRAVLLGGSGVLESARGRGVYRALVAARWEEARRLGHEGLTIHAGSMSKPILEHCGFEAVCRIDILEDTRLVTG
jgi:GNAT superfamily N-acetyltransferase